MNVDKRLAELVNCDKRDLVVAVFQAEKAISEFVKSDTLSPLNKYQIRLEVLAEQLAKLGK